MLSGSHFQIKIIIRCIWFL